MTDKKKIREEIERVKTVHSSVSLKDSKPDILAVQICSNLLSFIDSLPNDPESGELEEAAKRYATEGDEISGLYIIDEEADAFKAGAEWKKKQMMSKAIEGVITFNHDGRALFGFIVPDSFCDDVIFKDMDKVKLIIIKNDKDE